MTAYQARVAAGVLATLLALAGATLLNFRDATAQEAAPPATTTRTAPAPAASTTAPSPKAPASTGDARDSAATAAAGEQEAAPAPPPSKPATAGKGSPQRFEPSEKVRPDFDVAFPVDI